MNISRYQMRLLYLLSAVLLLGVSVCFAPPAAAAPSDDFVITVKTDNPGATSDTEFHIPPRTVGSNNYNVDCDNDGVDEAVAVVNDYTCSYGAPGTYTIRIKDNSGAMTGFPGVYFNGGGDAEKLLSVDQWGTFQLTSMSRAFDGCVNFNVLATDAPDLSAVTDLSYIFNEASSLDANLNNWDTSNVTNMLGAFNGAMAFNGNINGWNTANVTNMSFMFTSAFDFNRNIGGWDTGSVTDFSYMLAAAEDFNQDIGGWDTGSATNMRNMLTGTSDFNQDIGGWNTANVTNMSGMFANAVLFDQDISGWDTSQVTDMSNMFVNASAFNADIGGWNTANVTDMRGMFSQAASFNQDISGWDTGNVTSMYVMFYQNGVFNQDIGGWNTGNVTDMGSMFGDAYSFNQDIGGWDVTSLVLAGGMFSNSALSTGNYDALLIGWEAQAVLNGVTFDGGLSNYCLGEEARNRLINDHGWVITDDGLDCVTDVSLSAFGGAQADSLPAAALALLGVMLAGLALTGGRALRKARR